MPALAPKKFYRLKQEALEKVLGPKHPYVGHALIGYDVGGPVDMHYFLRPDGGTAFATMELLYHDGTGPQPSSIGTYELVAFTRHKVTAPEPNPPFDAIELRIRSMFTAIGRYSEGAVLNPYETVEVPGDEGEANGCVILDEYAKPGAPFRIGRSAHGLLLCVEVHRSEIEYARENGVEELIVRLRNAGHYPRSDLDREPVA